MQPEVALDYLQCGAVGADVGAGEPSLKHDIQATIYVGLVLQASGKAGGALYVWVVIVVIVVRACVPQHGYTHVHACAHAP